MADYNEADALAYGAAVADYWLVDPDTVENDLMMKFDARDDAARAAVAEFKEHDGDVLDLAFPEYASARIEKLHEENPEVTHFTAYDYLDVRDLEKRSQTDIDTLYDSSADDADRLVALSNLHLYNSALSDMGYGVDDDDLRSIPGQFISASNEGVTLLRDDYVDEDYMVEYFTNMGLLNSEIKDSPLFNYINWTAALEDYRNDCTEVTIDGVVYLWDN